jgi:UDP-GlcNAc:undecaprenyl-phosphate/decaprenyl-phosphate GlcNAc-1-phosphate transferase
MSRVFAAFAVSACASLLLTPLARWLAWRRGSLDRADGQRKLQPSPVPHLGGLAVFAALVTGVVVGFCGDGWAAQGSLPLALLASAALICLVGWCDDEFGLRVRWKLFGQVVATLPLVLTGQVLERVEFCGWVCDLGWWSLPITVAWLVAGTNALNFIDGIDGLTAAVGIVVAAATASIAWHLGNEPAMLLAVVLAGGLVGFLQYNWQPATIYLGDAGSMTIGLWLAALTLAGSHSEAIGSRLIVPLCLLLAPLADIALAIARRLLDGRRFWLPDRGHIHHRLVDRGFGVGRTVVLIAGISGAGCAVAFASAVHGRELLGWGALAMLLAALVRLGLMGQPEMELARRRILERAFHWYASRSVDRDVSPRPKYTLDALPPAAVWVMLIAELESYRVDRLGMTISAADGRQSRHDWCRSQIPDPLEHWTVEVEFDAPAMNSHEHGSCRFRAAIAAEAARDPLNWLSVMDVLRRFGPYWARNGGSLAEVLADAEPAPITGDRHSRKAA